VNLLDTDLPIVYLKPGEMHYSEKPCIVVTVLGSCVAITMFNYRFNSGSICHAVLPECRNEISPYNHNEMFKYVDSAIEMMLEKFIFHGLKPVEIEVKLFGGANMFQTKSNSHMTVGEQNIQSAINTISEKGLKIMATDVGGTKGRKIYFYPHTGEIYMKVLGKGAI